MPSVSGSNRKLLKRRLLDFENLESRILLSWPLAPFESGNLENAIYVNQLGNAVISNKLLKPAGDFDGYELAFDDPGKFYVGTTGKMHTQVAYYGPGRKPRDVNSGSRRDPNGRIMAWMPASKPTLYIGVRAADSKVTGKYNLVVDGVPHHVIYNTDISRPYKTISGENDTDFYRIPITSAGDWKVQVSPEDNLDITINVFDSDGNPVAGSFIKPINRAGPGKAESWTFVKPEVGSTYYVRVDGVGKTEAHYDISAKNIRPMPTAIIEATDPMAAEVGGNTGMFTVRRASEAGLDVPLTVRYSVSGTADAGKDYMALSGTLTIPAKSMFATILITPLKDRETEGEEAVILSLLSDAAYAVGAKSSAIVSIADAQSPA